MSNINNTKDNVVFEQNTNESANQQQQSTKPSFKEIYDKYFGIKVNPDYGKPHAPKTKFGYYVRQFDIGVQRFYRAMVHTVNYLVNRLLAYFAAADRTVRHAYPRVKKSQIVVYLRDGSDGRARVLGGRLLVD